jgi:simple sugar transport system ATP-binding protein
VGAATTIHQAIVDLAATGTAIVVVSEDLDELFEICDTIAVIAEGRLSPLRAASETSVEEIGRWMSGRFDGVQGQVGHAAQA